MFIPFTRFLSIPTRLIFLYSPPEVPWRRRHSCFPGVSQGIQANCHFGYPQRPAKFFLYSHCEAPGRRRNDCVPKVFNGFGHVWCCRPPGFPSLAHSSQLVCFCFTRRLQPDIKFACPKDPCVHHRMIVVLFQTACGRRVLILPFHVLTIRPFIVHF